MKHLWFFVVALLSGCAALTPPVPVVPVPVPIMVAAPVPPPIDFQCADMSKFVKSIVKLRLIGVKPEDLDQYISAPTVAIFPIRLLKKEAFSLKVDTPDEAYTQFYEICATIGYNNMFTYLQLREENRVNAAVLKEQPAPVAKKKKPTGKPKVTTNGQGN